MYVCLCKGITEEMLDQALKRSAKTSDALKHLGVGSDCGICLIEAVEKAQKRMNKLSRSNAPLKTNSLKK